MKYLVFASYNHEKKGGWDDFVGSAQTLDAAKKLGEKTCQADEDGLRRCNLCHIVHAPSLTKVLEMAFVGLLPDRVEYGDWYKPHTNT